MNPRPFCTLPGHKVNKESGCSGLLFSHLPDDSAGIGTWVGQRQRCDTRLPRLRWAGPSASLDKSIM